MGFSFIIDHSILKTSCPIQKYLEDALRLGQSSLIAEHPGAKPHGLPYDEAKEQHPVILHFSHQGLQEVTSAMLQVFGLDVNDFNDPQGTLLITPAAVVCIFSKLFLCFLTVVL